MFRIKKREQLGPIAQKILLLLVGGFSLSLTRSPAGYSRVIRDAAKEWKKINKQSLQRAIRRLYESKLVSYQENDDGTISIILNDTGKKRALRYNLDAIEIKKAARWDGQWRIVIFDIPEGLKGARDALAVKLRQMGFRAIQKSVLICPYECRNEVDFVVEVFNLRPYVRFIVATDIDISLELKHYFKIR